MASRQLDAVGLVVEVVGRPQLDAIGLVVEAIGRPQLDAVGLVVDVTVATAGAVTTATQAQAVALQATFIPGTLTYPVTRSVSQAQAVALQTAFGHGHAIQVSAVQAPPVLALGTSLSTGAYVPCGTTPEIGGTVTATFFDRKMAARVAMPHDWTSYDVLYFRRGSDATVGPMYIGWQFEDADFNYIHYYYFQTKVLVNAGSSQTIISQPPYTPTDIAAMRYLSVWAFASGTGGQGANTYYTFDAFGVFSFGGCPPPPSAAILPNYATIVG